MKAEKLILDFLIKKAENLKVDKKSFLLHMLHFFLFQRYL